VRFNFTGRPLETFADSQIRPWFAHKILEKLQILQLGPRGGRRWSGLKSGELVGVLGRGRSRGGPQAWAGRFLAKFRAEGLPACGHGGGGRWGSCSSEGVARPGQHAARGGALAPREEVGVFERPRMRGSKGAPRWRPWRAAARQRARVKGGRGGGVFHARGQETTPLL
jgi:hypothetical protein